MSLGRFAALLALTIGIGMSTGGAKTGSLSTKTRRSMEATGPVDGGAEPFSILRVSPYLVGQAAN